jgi:hypothetical protein
MGRGRAKAKQVKVARQLKYSGGGTDLDRLRAELGVESQHGASGDSTYADLDDSYSGDDDADHAPDEDDEDEDWEDGDYGDYDAEGLVRQSGPSTGA